MILTIGVNRSSDKFSDSTLAILAKTTAFCEKNNNFKKTKKKKTYKKKKIYIERPRLIGKKKTP